MGSTPRLDIKATTVTAKGPRENNEDTYCVENLGRGRILLGVFDGHGGREVAAMCAELAPKILAKLLQFETDVAVALRALYQELDNLALAKDYKDVGCCAAMVLITKERVWFSNCGDALIACKTSQGVYLKAQEHKVANEIERLESLGGLVTYWDGCARIYGCLNISRAIGDHALKKYVVNTPYITSLKIESSNAIEWICLASDGLWDVYHAKEYHHDILTFSNDENIENRDILKVLERVLVKAYSKGSMDNVTIVHSEITLK